MITKTSVSKKIIKLNEKWEKFKYFREVNVNYEHHHPYFLTMRQRESIIDSLFSYIFSSQDL